VLEPGCKVDNITKAASDWLGVGGGNFYYWPTAKIGN
jgi:hypothetical protein